MLSAFLLFMGIGQYRTPRDKDFLGKFLGVSRLLVPVTGTSLRRSLLWFWALQASPFAELICPWWGQDSGSPGFHKPPLQKPLQKRENLTFIFSRDNVHSILIAPGLVIQCQNVLAPENLHAKQIGSSKQEKGPSFSLPWNGLPVFVPLGLRLAYGWGVWEFMVLWELKVKW